jgi:outer membrane protein
MRESEKNIKTMELAIDQAEENFRINTEQYKEQIATQTDVLIAQTLLSRTRTNYYNALYDYEIAKAALYRAMGRFDSADYATIQ